MNATAKWLMCGASFGLALSANWAAAGTHQFATNLAISQTALAVTPSGDAATEARLLADARAAMKAGRLDEAQACIDNAQRLNIKHDPLTAGFKDSPERARRELEKLQQNQGGPVTPSSRFSAWPSSINSKPKPTMGVQGTDPFANRASDATIDRMTNDSKSKADRYLENGRNCLQQGDMTGAISWHTKARAENAQFGPGEYSPDALAADLAKAGVEISRLPANSAGAPRFNAQEMPRDDRDLAAQIPAYERAGNGRSAFQGSVINNPDDVQQERNPLTRSAQPEMIYNRTAQAGQSPLAEARRALAAGDVRRATELVQQGKQVQINDPNIKDSPEMVEALIRKSNQLSSGVRPGVDPAQYSREYASFMVEQAGGLLQYGDLGSAERLAQQAKNVKVNYRPGELTPDVILDRVAAAKQTPSASPREERFAAAPTAGPAPRRLPTTAGTEAAPSSQKQQAMQLMARARLAMDQGDVQAAHQMAQQAQDLRVPDSEFTQNETRPWQVLMESSRALSRRGIDPNVRPAGAVENTIYREDGGYAVQPSVFTPGNDNSRIMAAQATEDAPEPGALPTGPRTQGVWDGDPETAGQQFYDAGMKAFAAGDRDTALQYFKQSWKYQGQLDGRTAANLRDKLLALESPRPERLPVGGEPSPLQQLDQKTELLRQKLLKEIQSEDAAADRLRDSDPEGALGHLQTLRERINAAEIDPAGRKQLLVFVDRKIADMERYIEANLADIQLDKANRRVREGIEREQLQTIEAQTKLAELVDQFNKLIDEQRYHEAEVIAKQANEIAPEEPVVKALVWKAHFVKQIEFQKSIAARKEAGFLDQLAGVDESSIPFNDNDPYQFGDTKAWMNLTKERRQMLNDISRRMSPAEIEIRQALDKPVEVSFTNRPLAEVIDTLSKMVNVNMHLDPRGLHAEGVTTNTPVSLNLARPISLKSSLNMILEQLHLSYVIQNEVLVITSQQTRDSNLINKVYNVADLVIPIPNFTPSYNMGLPSAIQSAYQMQGYGGAFGSTGGSSMPLTFAANEQPTATSPLALGQAGMTGSMSGGRPAQMMTGPGSLGGGVQADFDSLIELITSTVQPNSWKEGGVGEGTIAPFETNLSIVVSQTEEVHSNIADLLEQLRRLQDLQVTIEVRFITLNDNFFERIGIDFDFNIDDNTGSIPILPDDVGPSMVIGLDPTGQPTASRDVQFTQNSFSTAIPQFGGFDPATAANFGFAILSDIEVFFLLQAATGDTRTNVLQAPKVTLFNGQQAVVSDTSQRPFVTSVIPVVGDFAAAHQPVIVVLSEGTSLSVQAVVSADRRFVRLTLVPFFSQIGDVEEFTFTGATTTSSGTAVVDPTNPGRTLADNNTTTTSGTTVQLPTFSFTTVTTTVSVPDGGTVLLGGIKRLSEGRNERGVPLLSKIPYASRLFKNVGIGRTTQSLMMMVTPRIIIQEEEEAKIIGNNSP